MLSLTEHSQESTDTLHSEQCWNGSMHIVLREHKKKHVYFTLLGNEKKSMYYIYIFSIQVNYRSYLKILLEFVCMYEIFTRCIRLFLFRKNITHVNLR